MEQLELRDPNNSFINKIGELEPGEKIKLPYPMASMNKLKDMKTISYPKLIPYLVDTIQELTKRIEKLEEDK